MNETELLTEIHQYEYPHTMITASAFLSFMDYLPWPFHFHLKLPSDMSCLYRSFLFILPRGIQLNNIFKSFENAPHETDR
jgi:hypothetical protein